ncbi:MAG: FxSxx-COOH system tetratricopeptide repeat protein, partial [Streptosporangiaceae bacterium]
MSGLGRTAAMVNVAAILAGTEKRVLIVDWSGETPAASEYLSRFDTGSPGEATNLAELLDSLTRERATGRWQARRFDLPGGLGQVDVVTALVRPADDTPPELPFGDEPLGQIVDRLRQALDRSGYDHVLVDAPTAPGPRSAEVIAQGANATVLLFGTDLQSATQSVHLAKKIKEQAQPNMRIHPVRSELSPFDTITVELALTQGIIGQILPDAAADLMTLPRTTERGPDRDRPSQQLTILTAEPGDPLIAAYAELTSRLTDGEVSGPPVIPAELRDNYRAAVGLTGPETRKAFTLVHAWADRPWADWISAQLGRCGTTVVPTGPDGADGSGPTVVLISTELPAVPAALLASPEPVLAVCLPGVGAESADHVPTLLIAELTARESALRLLGRLNLVPGPNRPDAFTPAFPADPPGSAGPRRHPQVPSSPLAGRTNELSALRDVLLAQQDGCVPHVITGPPGIGKTALVLEYVRMFGADYQEIWWISARTRETARNDLTELGRELRIGQGADAAAAAVEQLMASRTRPWLLIYDDADDLGRLDGLIPSGGRGHALVTGRTLEPSAQALEPLPHADAIRMLRRKYSRLGNEHAAAIATVLAGQPLALELAGSWIRRTAGLVEGTSSVGALDAGSWATSEFLARFGHPDDPVAECLSITLRSLDEYGTVGRLAARLLELCSWLSPDGIGHWLLASPPFLRALVASTDVTGGALIEADTLALDQVLHLADRYGLIELVRGHAPVVRMHRRIQEAIRTTMPPDIAAQRREAVWMALAEIAPPEAAGPVRRSPGEYRELSRHFAPAQVAQGTSPHVRRLVVRQVAFHYTTGDREIYDGMLPLAERLVGTWPEDVITGRLYGQIANIRRQHGEYTAALTAGDSALRILRAAGEAGLSWALNAAQGRAGDLLGLGRFTEALGEMQDVYQQSVWRFGRNHPVSVVAEINLATYSYLTGLQQQAVETARRCLARQIAEFGVADWLTLRIGCRFVDFLCAAGQY